MEKALELAKIIRKNIGGNHLELLEDYNLRGIFNSIFTLTISTEDCNIIVCFIIYAYTPNSLWLDLKKDRNHNKEAILLALEADSNKEVFRDLLYNKNEIVNISVFNYLEQLKGWEWRAVFDLLDYASKMSRFASKETEEEKSWDVKKKDGEKETLTEDIDIKTIVSVNKDKGTLLQQAIDKRMQADELMDKIRKNYVHTDDATQSDFGFKFTDTAKQRDVMSWREFIRNKNERKQAI